MHKKKSKKSKHILTTALASLIVLSAISATVMSGCGENSESTNETKTVTETEVVTVVVDETYATDASGNNVSAENSDSKNSSGKSESSENSENSSSQKTNNSNSSADSSSVSNNSGNSASSTNNNSNNSNKNNSNSSSNNSISNNSSSSIKTNSSSSNTHKPVTGSNACTIDGNKFAVGDTVTCVYKLTSPEKLINYQAEISYDTKYLSVKSAYLDGPADSGGLLNYNLNGKIKFNGVNISTGYNYTKADNFVVVNYEIKASGSTTPSFNWIVATGVSEKAYVKDGKAVNGLKLTNEYT